MNKYLIEALEEVFAEAMSNIAGSCSLGNSKEHALEYYLHRFPSSKELDLFTEFLEANECYECEFCGWWTHPGELCDCIVLDEVGAFEKIDEEVNDT